MVGLNIIQPNPFIEQGYIDRDYVRIIKSIM